MGKGVEKMANWPLQRPAAGRKGTENINSDLISCTPELCWLFPCFNSSHDVYYVFHINPVTAIMLCWMLSALLLPIWGNGGIERSNNWTKIRQRWWASWDLNPQSGPGARAVSCHSAAFLRSFLGTLWSAWKTVSLHPQTISGGGYSLGGPVIRTPSFHSFCCQGPVFSPWSGN